jgi:hypothetical protein
MFYYLTPSYPEPNRGMSGCMTVEKKEKGKERTRSLIQNVPSQ